MAKTVIGLFDRANEAQSVVQDLMSHGFTRDDISVIASNEKDQYGSTSSTTSASSSASSANTPDRSDHVSTGAGTGATAGTVIGGALGLLAGLGVMSIPGFGPIILAGPLVATLTGAGIGAGVGGLAGALIGWGIPEEDAHTYAEGIRRGGTLVAVKADEEDVDEVSDIFNNHDAVDIEKRSAEWRSSGWTPGAATGTGAGAAAGSVAQGTKNAANRAGEAVANTGRAVRDSLTGGNTTGTSRTGTGSNIPATPVGAAGKEEARLPVVEEELAVGKRLVNKGGVRIYQHVTERPVTENVNLREERVVVERRPADRAVEPRDLENFKEGTVEVTETAEEAVVSKRPKVVEEVVVRKDAAERTEQVTDTVRRTDVEVEKIHPTDAGRTGANPNTNDPSRDRV